MSSQSNPSDGSRKRTLGYWLGSVPVLTLAFVSCVVLFAMMVLTFVDVVGRKFGNPVSGANEVISLMMPALVFCILPLVNMREGHVTIDLLDKFVPTGVKRVQAVLVSLLSAGAMALIAWRLYVKAASHLEFNEATDDLVLSLWWFSGGASVLAAVATVALIANMINYLIGARRPPALEINKEFDA